MKIAILIALFFTALIGITFLMFGHTWATIPAFAAIFAMLHFFK